MVANLGFTNTKHIVGGGIEHFEFIKPLTVTAKNANLCDTLHMRGS